VRSVGTSESLDAHALRPDVAVRESVKGPKPELLANGWSLVEMIKSSWPWAHLAQAWRFPPSERRLRVSGRDSGQGGESRGTHADEGTSPPGWDSLAASIRQALHLRSGFSRHVAQGASGGTG
jgi:hypothetical protein